MSLDEKNSLKSGPDSNATMSVERRKRINRLKMMIIASVIAILTALLITCGILVGMVVSGQKKINKLEKENKSLKEENKELSEGLEVSLSEQVNAEIESHGDASQPAKEETSDPEPTNEQLSDVKKVYLTFDDGPSENTGAVLDVLQRYGVKATFFVIGKTDEASIALYKRIVQEGHSLGIHSYSHKYNQIYESLDTFKNDVLSLQAWLKEVTGQEVYCYRFPGGSSNTVSKVPISDCIRFLTENGFKYYDWNATNGDATGKKITAEGMVGSVMSEFEKKQNLTVLMHDGPGKAQTAEVLPAIIEHLQAGGAQILPITDDTVPSQHKTVESVMGQ